MQKSYTKIGIILIGYVFSPLLASADIYPSDANTVTLRNETGTDHLNALFLDNTDGHTRTILGIALQQTTAKESTVYCGNATSTGAVIFDGMNSVTTSFQRFMVEKCALPIHVDNMRTSFIGMTYVDRDIGIATSTPVHVDNFSATTTVTSPFFNAMDSYLNTINDNSYRIVTWLQNVHGEVYNTTLAVDSLRTNGVGITNFPAIQNVSLIGASTTINLATSTISAIYGGANFQEWLTVACVIIFFLAILAWPTFFRMFRRQDPI